MGKSIVDIKNMGDALRNTGYKNIVSAVSEIIDNSVEANAKNIFLILREGIAASGRKVVKEIGFLDNGDGMNSDILGSCLGIGSSTRKARKGMGRFGVGLPQASLYACPEIVVYSWQDGVENAQKVYLDINKIKDGEQTEIEDPIGSSIPEPYTSYIKYQTLTETYDFSKSGTLVIWKNCDRIKPKTRGPLVDTLEFNLGQKFRYFIHDGVSRIKMMTKIQKLQLMWRQMIHYFLWKITGFYVILKLQNISIVRGKKLVLNLHSNYILQREQEMVK